MCDVLIATGEVEHQAIDIDLPGYPSFEFWRLYASSSNVDGPMGTRWRHSWERYLTAEGESINLYDGVADKRTYPIQSQDPTFLFDADRLTVSFRNGSRSEYHRRRLESQIWRLVRQEDPHGLWVELRYSDDQLSRVLDAHGRYINFGYGGGRLEQVAVRTGEASLITSYAHDRKGRLIEAIDASGRREIFEYDGLALVLHVEKRGARRCFAYDRNGRCALNWYEGNKRIRRLRWSAKADWAALTDSYGITDAYRLDGHRPITLTDPLNRRSEWIYDPHGSLLCRTMPDGRPYLLSSWDAQGNILTSIDLRGARTEYHFENGRLARITNVAGVSLIFGRNQAGDITSMTGPDGSQWRFDYDERGSLTRATDPSEYWIGREEIGRRIRVYDHFGEIAQYTYDDVGNLRSIREADSGELTCSYASQDKLVALTSPGGGVVRWLYDPQGRIAEVIDPLGRSTRFRYTLFGSTSEIESADGTRVQFLHDNEERLTAIINTKGEVTDFEYDDANRVVAIRFFDGRIDRHNYDELNRVVEVTNDTGVKMRLAYDETVNPIMIEFPGGIRQENTFNELGQLMRMERTAPPDAEEQNDVLEFKYNDNGFIISESDGRSPVSYHLDIRGKLLGIGDEEAFSTQYDRDPRGRPVAMRDPSGAYAFHYGAGNQLLRIVLPNGAEQHFEYDNLLRQTKRVLIGPKGDERCSRRYRYDIAGQLVWMKDWRLGVRTYDYDVRGRLAVVRDEQGNPLEEYVYDSEGNIVQGPGITYATIGPGNRVMSAGLQAYSYDEEGRLAAIESGPDSLGFQYGPFNTLRSCVSDSGHTTYYRYDLLGRRTAKKTALDHVRFRYHGNRLVRIASTVDGNCDFTYAADTLVPISQRSAAQRNFFYTFDQIGTPTEIWDEDCELVAAVTATAYGWKRRIESAGGGKVVVPFHFPGQIVDEETGLHYNRFRYYWPLHGRYNVHDPIGLKISLNLYSYVRDPLTWIDPFGLNPIMMGCGYANGTPFDACGQYAARHKVDQINKASKSRRKKTCSSCRENEQADYFKKTCGGNPMTGNDVDHSLELQLGGADNCCANLVAINHSVNRSFGSQIRNLIADFPEGAQIPQFAFNPPGCDQADSCTDKANAVQRGTKSDGKDCEKEPALDC